VTLKYALQFDAYPIGFITQFMKLYSRSIRLKNEVQPLGLMCIPYIRGFSEKFNRISNRHNIKTVFKTGHSLRNTLMRTRPISANQETANCVYNIPYECGRSYNGGNKQTVSRETPGIQEKFGSRPSGKIQTSATFFRREIPYTLERSEDFRDKRIQCTGSARKRPMWHVYKILSAGPASKLLPSGTLRLGMKFLNVMFDPMKVPNFSTVGVSGVWIFSACVMVLYLEFMALIMVSMVLICGAFQTILCESCGCF